MKTKMEIKKIIVTKINFFVLFLLISCNSFSQQIFHQDIFFGGVTVGGFSTGQGSGSGTLNLYIEPGSTIKKAYLFTYRQGFAPNVPITINGTPYLFDTTNSVMQITHNHAIVSPVYMYSYDFTNDLNNNITSTFNITIPNQSGLPAGWGYFTLFIYIAYENPVLPKIATSLWINDKDFIGNEFYNFKDLSPINNTVPVGFSLFIDRACNNTTDGTIVTLNSTSLGVIGGSDAVNNNWNCSGVKGHFYYQNSMLFGLDDDIPNNTMDSVDGLADISPYLNNNDTAFTSQLTHQNYPNMSTSGINSNLAFFLTYTTPCDTFSTSATATQDTICLGDSVQLNATGGSTYSWFGAFGGLSDTSIANPMASPPQTTTYIVTIKNDSGCVKTEHVKIWVTQPIDSTTTTPTICGNATGSITSHFNTNANYNFTLFDNNFNPLANNTTGVFNQLAEGTYIVENTLHNCALYDTVTVNAINNVIANFYSLPQAPFSNPNQPLGKAPMEVSFFNTSQNANGYQWSVVSSQSGDTLAQHSTFNTQHFFTEGGTYEVCLIAYNNQPQCADTVCKTIFMDPNEEISLFIPNVFTPNGDNENDNFVIQLIGTEYLENLEVQLFNRWGQEVEGSRFDVQSFGGTSASAGMTELVIWNGNTTAGSKASEGTYFYVVSYTTKLGETVTQKGNVTLLR